MDLKIKRLQTQLLQVQAARAEQELRILERMDEIERLKKAIQIQQDKEAELQKEISDSQN